MSVIVKRGLVDDGKRIYGPGEVIDGLSEKDENDLIESGVCEWLDSYEEPDDPPAPPSGGAGEGDSPTSPDDLPSTSQSEPQADDSNVNLPEEDGPNTDILADVKPRRGSRSKE
ncbi:hypothetical protein ABEV74_11010 [Paenibacillus cisolokensis]|uniref:hypothetical protein n=1 Tax=Paenibacillus cisolokensis TaxID=1658519 RepID=UPI003D2A33C3